eukprot:6213159-Prymnesium_polylepis.2
MQHVRWVDRHVSLAPTEQLHLVVEDGEEDTPRMRVVGREGHVHCDRARIAVEAQQWARPTAVPTYEEVDAVAMFGIQPTRRGCQIARLSRHTTLTLQGQQVRQLPKLLHSWRSNVSLQLVTRQVELVLWHPVHRVREHAAPHVNRAAQREAARCVDGAVDLEHVYGCLRRVGVDVREYVD